MAQDRPTGDDVPTESGGERRPPSDGSKRVRLAFEEAVGGSGELTPERIGPYRVLGRIGRGGMGSVYKATDDSEGGRKLVAIKLIDTSVDNAEAASRFELERRLLASLEHPNIARLYDASRTREGRPYFVMEFVDGQPIDQYCDENRLPIRKRLELFCKVCAAVHHAHSNLIVHRDLKPANILVTGDGEPKLLDFGIAKMLNPNLASVQPLTRPGFRVMTPEYASPEQVRGGAISIQSDVYSLGVLLYELLCGQRPYRFETRLEEEIVRIVCETEPERPSTALSRVHQRRTQDGTTETIGPDTVAQWRADRLEHLRRSLTGDLDDIVLAALAKTPRQRYASAERFSADIARFLEGKPVEARKTHARSWYQFKKFLNRHRAPVVAAAVAIFAVTAGGVGVALQWRAASIASEARAVALEEKLVAEERARAAEQDQLIATRFSDSLWKRASRNLSFSMSPENREAFWEGVHADFEQHAETFGENNPIVQRERARALLETASALGGIRAGNQGEFDAALAAYEAARDDLVALFEQDPDDLSLWSDAVGAQLRVADSLRRLSRSREAVLAYQRAVDLAERVAPPPDDLDAQRQQSKPRFSLAQAAVTVGDAETARDGFQREISDRRRRLSRFEDDANASRDLYVALYNYAEFLRKSGEADAAAPLLAESLQMRRQLLERAAKNPTLRRDVALGLFAGGISDLLAGDADAAMYQAREAAEMLQSLVGERPDDARSLATLAFGYAEAAESALEVGSNDLVHDWTSGLAEAVRRLEEAAMSHAALPELRARRLLLTAQLSLADDRAHEAYQLFTLARDQLAALSSADEGSVFAKRRLADATFGMGESKFRNGTDRAERASAIAAFRSASEIYSELRDLGPVAVAPEQRETRLAEILDSGSP